MDESKKELDGIFSDVARKPKIKNYPLVFVTFVLVAVLSGVGSSYYFTNLFIEKTRDQDASPRIIEKVSMEEDSAVVDSVNKVFPSVVSIVTVAKGVTFFGEIVEQKGGGTGFIITSDGLIITNKHVVAGAENLNVITSDGSDYVGQVVATDPIFDFALVKIEAKGLPVVEMGDSDSLQIGQRVIAIGNALGEYSNSVTVGVVSGRARSISASDRSGSSSRLEGLIQTDAPINPGNSGGPLINTKGQVVGVNTAIDAQANSISFAIPINSAKTAINSYLKNGSIVRPFMGIRYINITREFSALNKLDVNAGALIVAGTEQGETIAIVPGGPADKAGLMVNDIITQINGEKISENKSVITILSAYNPGDKVEIIYLRKGEEKKTTVELGELK